MVASRWPNAVRNISWSPPRFARRCPAHDYHAPRALLVFSFAGGFAHPSTHRSARRLDGVHTFLERQSDAARLGGDARVLAWVLGVVRIVRDLRRYFRVAVYSPRRLDIAIAAAGAGKPLHPLRNLNGKRLNSFGGWRNSPAARDYRSSPTAEKTSLGPAS